MFFSSSLGEGGTTYISKTYFSAPETSGHDQNYTFAAMVQKQHNTLEMLTSLRMPLLVLGLLLFISLQRQLQLKRSILFSNQVTDNPEWPKNFVRTMGMATRAECVDATQYVNGISYFAAEYDQRCDYRLKKTFQLKNTSVL